MKLLTRYNQYTITVMIIVFILFGIVSYLSIKKILMNELDKGLLKDKDLVQQYINQHHSFPAITSFNRVEVQFEPSHEVLSKPYFKTLIKFKAPNRPYTSRQLLYTTSVGKKNYLVEIGNELEGTKQMTTLVFTTTLLTIFILIITILLINALLMTKLWRPFYQVLNEVKGFRINQSNQPDFPKTQIEEFNFMISCLSIAIADATENYRMLKEFTENASHEIQTPLAIIRSKLDLLVQHEGLTDKETTSLRAAYGAIKKLSLINRDLLLITKIENHQFENSVKIDLLHTIEEKIIEFQELWHLKRLELRTALHPAEITVSKELIDILINNVLSNATKHNRQGGKVIIQLRPSLLEVANTGIDNPLDENLIFKRFYKMDDNDDNNGLGLSIVRQICQASGIEIGYKYAEGLHIFSFRW
jgi:signal transduction histidine kinase